MLPGNRKFEVTLSDERIDLTKARRIEPHPPCPTWPSAVPSRSSPRGPVDPPPMRKRNPSTSLTLRGHRLVASGVRTRSPHVNAIS